jgi:quercetin dioxygenase-like cupin family protein
VRLIIVLLVTGVAAGSYAVGASSQTSGQASRAALAQAVDPVGAKGRTLGLSRVTIPPHVQLALHHHAGTQIAYVQKGTLTYFVRTGAVKVYRGAADQHPRVVRRVTAGKTGKVFAGEWVIEQPHVIHFGANNGSTPVVILLATLFTNGSPPSIPVG